MLHRMALHRLADILEHIALIRGWTKGMGFAGFERDRRTRYAVQMALLYLADAVASLPQEMRARHGHIPWRGISEIGSLFRREDGGVDAGVIWNTVQHELTLLEEAIRSEYRDLTRT